MDIGDNILTDTMLLATCTTHVQSKSVHSHLKQLLSSQGQHTITSETLDSHNRMMMLNTDCCTSCSH